MILYCVGIDILAEFGVLQRDLKNYEASIETLKTVLMTCEKNAGRNISDPMVAYLTFQLAVSFQAAGNLQEAESLYRDIYANNVIDVSNIGFKEFMGRYEHVLMQQEKFDEVKRIFSELLPSVRDTLGQTDKVYIFCLSAVAKAMHSLNDHSGCIDRLKEVITLMEDSNENMEYSFDIALSRSNLATLLHQQNRYAEADIYYRLALESYLHIVNEHIQNIPPQSVKVLWDSIVIAHRNYAAFMEHADRLSEASTIYTQLLDLLAEHNASNEEVKITISAYNTLALKLHEDRKCYPEAEQALRVCLHHQNLIEGEHGLDSLVLRVNLADNLRSQDKLVEAETHLHVAVPALREFHGPSDKATIFGMNVLAAVYRGLEKFTHAEPLLREVLEFNTSTLGPNHPETLMGKCNLGICLSRLDNAEEGKNMVVEAVKGLKNSVGPSHDATISAMCSLAAIVLSSEKDEAIEILEETLESVEKSHGQGSDVFRYVERQLNHAMAA